MNNKVTRVSALLLTLLTLPSWHHCLY